MRKIGMCTLLFFAIGSGIGCGSKPGKTDLSSTPGSGNTSGSGVIAEEWAGIPGDGIPSLLSNKKFPSDPSSRSFLTSLAAPRKNLEGYGTRIRGYIRPTQSGPYTFFITGDNESQFFLSSDENPDNLSPQPISFLTASEWTSRDEWEKFPGQTSRPVQLQAGTRYYFQVLHKNGGGEGGVAVGWRLPNGQTERPIAGDKLATFEADSPAAENAQNDSYHNQLKSMLLTKFGIIGGTWVFSSNIDLNTTNIQTSREGSTASVVSVTDQPFTKAVELAVNEVPK
ncbi:MAG: PA14 domain-containing protein, partial [Pseudobdellovibrionaceae bacterium]|nr:PA14 domain-containing protein [Pseudobdellovibrionaceae bacterium]